LESFDIPAVAVNAALGEGVADPPNGAVIDSEPPEVSEVLVEESYA